MKTIFSIVVIVLLMFAEGAYAGDSWYLGLGVGAVGSTNDLVDREGNGIGDEPIGRIVGGYRHNFNGPVTLDVSAQHFSGAVAEDGGINWLGATFFVVIQ